MAPWNAGRNRSTGNGGLGGVQRSYASQLKESEALFNSYEHLQGLPRGEAALTMLRKVASLVKPIMRKHGWKVRILAEFLPPEPNLLGLNINRGYKICLRLRYHNNPDLFLPVEQVVDTMLHELSHNIWGDHDSNFHRLWDELRDEHDVLIRKGYTGEGFLSEGHRLGGDGYGMPPVHEMRRLARASAEKRQAQKKLSKSSGQRLGGTPLHLYGGDVRKVIADQVLRRNTIDKGCASGRGDAIKLADQSADHVFKTKADEDDANSRAIAQALYELMEEEEERKLQGTFSAAPTDVNEPGGTTKASKSKKTSPSETTSLPASNPFAESSLMDLSEPFNPDEWTCEVCTCINPMQFLACDACGSERPQGAVASASSRLAATRHPQWTTTQPIATETMGWNCMRCGTFMEHKWWTCSACGLMKSSS
ncbi:hypothetical protein M433DRAFT_140551 [Acidomyces richmondensis BFW]|nr:MAG: hypothetical protein FE78DRAFT_74357 [Acidomyces sp. 'richmondensis']KYG48943.1 hypothetical protein M433DRAFT_140551 [Acidomyces richmondensis BFW]